ncbi:MAG: major capsid protein [Candidatus Methanomethylicaceae archaeon]
MKRSKFSLSHYKLMSMNMGHLVPCGITEVLPGDTIQHATSLLLRASPLLAPVMHPVHVRVHHWYVPFRLIWEDFEKFITGGEDGMDESEFPFMEATADHCGVGTLGDYLGLPPEAEGLEVSALPFRAYALVFNEWYRDQDLVQSVPLSRESGEDTTTNIHLLNCAWEKDYFTSARPWEQKGPAVTVPIGTEAPVRGVGFNPTGQPMFANGDIIDTLGTRSTRRSSSGESQANPVIEVDSSNNPQVFADLTQTTGVSINLLREAFALQRFEEARARYGSRYTEYLRYLGVRSSDARLQRPEYLGGGKQTIQFSEVLQTAEGDSPVGEMRGHGIAALRSNRYRRFFEEHGYVLSFISVKPKTMYAQGVARHWNRRVKEDFWQRELQHIGQQEVLNKEIKADHASPDGVFGYQDRYDEYRRQESTIAGEFRESILDHWHFARIFATDPALNADFVTANPTKRVFASQINDTLYCMANHSIQARRLVARTGHSYIF